MLEIWFHSSSLKGYYPVDSHNSHGYWMKQKSIKGIYSTSVANSQVWKQRGRLLQKLGRDLRRREFSDIVYTGLYLDHCVNIVHESMYMFIHLPIPIRSWEQCVAMKFYNPLYLVRMTNRYLAVIIGKSNTTVADWLGFLGQLTRNITMILFTIRTDTLTHLFYC